MTYGLEAIVPMELLVKSWRLTIQENLSMEESKGQRVQELLKLEQESISLAKMLQRRQKDWADRHGKTQDLL